MGGILVTGGAGYVGSHVVRRLAESGEAITVVDDLSTGHREAIAGVRLVEGDFADPVLLERELAGGRIDAIVHLAASCEVAASVADPAAYYRNNVVRSLGLLEAACRHGVRGFVFSSSAAVYGEPIRTPIDEDHPARPTNPYGETKLAFERALAWHAGAGGIAWAALRYFNAAGAHPSGEIGEDHEPESHLVPRLLRAAGQGAGVVPIHGDDWPTPDGTCVRDYVHVVDLAEAHRIALEALRAGELRGEAFNLGNGRGFSVMEVVESVARVTGRRPAVRIEARRPGDPAVLVASSARIASRLAWRPLFSELDAIVETAWRWHRAHPRGYRAVDGGRPGD